MNAELDHLWEDINPRPNACTNQRVRWSPRWGYSLKTWNGPSRAWFPLSPEEAAAWFIDRGYELPDDLRHHGPGEKGV